MALIAYLQWMVLLKLRRELESHVILRMAHSQLAEHVILLKLERQSAFHKAASIPNNSTEFLILASIIKSDWTLWTTSHIRKANKGPRMEIQGPKIRARLPFLHPKTWHLYLVDHPIGKISCITL